MKTGEPMSPEPGTNEPDPNEDAPHETGTNGPGTNEPASNAPVTDEPGTDDPSRPVASPTRWEALLDRLPPTRSLRGVLVLGSGAVAVAIAVAGAVLGAQAIASVVEGPDVKSATFEAGPADIDGTAPSGSLSPSPKAPAPTVTASGPKAAGSGQKVVRPSPSGTTAAPHAGATPTKKAKVVEPKASTTAATAPKAAVATVGPKVQIKNLVTGLCLDLPPGATVDTKFIQNTCSYGADQQFQLIRQGGEFAIRDVESHFCLNVWGTGSNDAADVTAYECVLGDADNMMFRTQAQGDGYFLVNVKSDLCLDVSDYDGRGEPGAGLTLFTCSSSDDHIWQVV